MIDIMEINASPALCDPRRSPPVGGIAASTSAASAPAPHHQQQQQQQQHHPRLKRSPYLAAMCHGDSDNDLSTGCDDMVLTMMATTATATPSPAVVHDGRLLLRAAGDREKGKKNKVLLANDFFELKRPSVVGSSESSGQHGIGSKVRPRHGRPSLERPRIATYGAGRVRGSTTSVHSLPQGGSDYRPRSNSLQYYYPNPFNRNDLLAMLEGANGSSPNPAAASSSSGSSSGGETTESETSTKSSGGGAGAFVPAPATFDPSRPPLAKRMCHGGTSLPAIAAAQRRPSGLSSSRHFFPSVLDPIDGREHDLNRQSRNEAWREIDPAELLAESDDDDDLPDGEIRGEDDERMKDAEERRGEGGSPCTPAGATPEMPTRRSLTVGAGLAYGRIPGWHIRPRLSGK